LGVAGALLARPDLVDFCVTGSSREPAGYHIVHLHRNL
jgi:hypothetical protein